MAAEVASAAPIARLNCPAVLQRDWQRDFVIFIMVVSVFKIHIEAVSIPP
jgi:hypothetical protein